MILVIDDEPMITDIAERILTRAGFEVATVNSGRDAVERCTDNPDQVDLVLLDLTMDDMPGVEILRRLRLVCPDLPCIISSGQAPSPSDIPADLSRNLSFLQKPYRAGQLVALVKEILQGAAPQPASHNRP